jgi:hypothetical protein
MPDISMCAGAGCLRKDRCYRHTATPSEFWQSHFAPLKDDGTCDFFWPTTDGERNTDSNTSNTKERES